MATPATDHPVWRTWRAALSLVLVSLAGFGLVAVMHEATRARIAAIEHERNLETFREVLHGQQFDNDLLKDTVTVRDADLLGTRDELLAYRARWHGQAVAVVLAPVAPDGYSGAIHLLVAIAPDGHVLGVRVTQHHETPGLGDAIDARKSTWIERFAGRSLGHPPAERWRVRRDGGDFDQFTGATVTPRAVVTAVARALEYFSRHREALLAAPAKIPP
jgi:electron transport complex protein RnfG